MFLTVHATAGVIVGQNTDNIGLAFIMGFISHFILDLIPHGDQDLGKNNSPAGLKLLLKIGIIDAMLVMGLISYLFTIKPELQTPSVIFGIIGALLPDAINAMAIFFKPKILDGYRAFHVKLHYLWNGFTLNMQQGFTLQAIFLLSLLVVIFAI